MTKAKKTTKMTKAEVAKIKKIVYCEKVLRLIKHIESLEKRLGSKEARTNP
jgi:hypothetical protein